MYDVFGLGNALVDTEVAVNDRFLQTQQIAKGLMTLVDSERMAELTHELADQPMQRFSGGSGANTIFSVQGFGLRAGYTCKVAQDAVGDFFINELSAAGIDVNANAQTDEGRSGQCLIMVTDDAERTMNTDLGISVQLSSLDVPDQALRQSTYCYVEGYLSASEPSAAAAIHCREVAEQAGVKVSLSLSDPSMVELFRDALSTMLGNGVDQVFCNEEEALAWAKTDRLDIAMSELRDIAPEVYITLGAQGSVAVTNHTQHQAPGLSVKAVDTTGAGDIYAGAVLAARLQGAEPLQAAKFANYCAGHIVTLHGARLKSIAEYQKLQTGYTG
ncbi:MAG: adenosine kinase [Pseudomonadota bacterium]